MAGVLRLCVLSCCAVHGGAAAGRGSAADRDGQGRHRRSAAHHQWRLRRGNAVRRWGMLITVSNALTPYYRHSGLSTWHALDSSCHAFSCGAGQILTAICSVCTCCLFPSGAAGAGPAISAFQKAIRGDCEVLRDHICKEMNELNLERCRCIPKGVPGADWRVLQEIVAAEPDRANFKARISAGMTD